MPKRYMLALMLFAASPAGAVTVHLSTKADNPDVSWTVSEVSGGSTTTAGPTYVGHTDWGSISGFTIPFTDNDGFWTAQTSFTLPAGATAVTMMIKGIGVDDRAVIELNGTAIAACGTNSTGAGLMTLRDGGANNSYEFPYEAGRQAITVSSGFVTGKNTITVIVNNTYAGINGSPRPPSSSDLTEFGLAGHVSYTAAAQ